MRMRLPGLAVTKSATRTTASRFPVRVTTAARIACGPFGVFNVNLPLVVAYVPATTLPSVSRSAHTGMRPF